MRNMRCTKVAAIVVLAACSKEHDTSSPPPKPESTLIGKGPFAMHNCPSGVLSSVTTSKPVADGVELTITSADERARSEIFARARFQEIIGDPWRFLPAHSGVHGGSGTMGYCPIIHANTLVSYERIADGVRVHVKARKASDILALQQATDARVRALLPSS
jgi:hypothetical protein